MACIITGTNWYVGPLTAEDIEKQQGMFGGLREKSRKGNLREHGTEQRGEGSVRQQPLQQQTEGGASVENEVESEAGE